jgi:hypothetical protein
VSLALDQVPEPELWVQACVLDRHGSADVVTRRLQ